MGQIISTQLLSEVLKEKVLSFNQKNNEIFIQFDNYDDIWNIYELANKMKLWAIDLGFGVMTSENQDGVSVKLFGPYGLVKEFAPIDNEKYVFNYCQWILNSGFYRKKLKDKNDN